MVTESATGAFLFSVQRALPDELPAALNGLAVDTDEKTLYIRCFFRGPVTESGREFMSYLREAVWADFFPTIHVEVEELDANLVGVLPVGTWLVRREAPELVLH
ncbi:MAG TPA: hypothetical protein VD969_01280 [Symbiobacteriaceae bacterium]|nr:hypothetical protein [Symbiobacteriaceae bacterium]